MVVTRGVAAPSRTVGAYEQLRADILRGVFRPGHRLKLVELSGRLGVSQSVLREVLTRLSEQGLVVASPQRGFSVVPLSADALTELTNVRVHNECWALRSSVANGDLAWEAEIVSAHHALHRTPMHLDDGRPNDLWSTLHVRFHRALVAACGNALLLSIVDSLRERSELYRHWSGSLAGDRARDPVREHEALMELTLARDAEAASSALEKHIERASVRLLAWVEAQQPTHD